MAEGEKAGEKKLTRRGFLKGAVGVAGGAIASTVLSGCLPGDEKLVGDLRATATARAKKGETVEAQKAVQRATQEAPFKKATEVVEKVITEKQALFKAIKRELSLNEWDVKRLIEVREVGGAHNPTQQIGRIITDKVGGNIRWLPIESHDEKTRINCVKKPDGSFASGIEKGMPIRGIQFEVEMHEPEKGGIRSLWYALRVDRLREKSFITFPSNTKVLNVTSENKVTYQYVFICARMGTEQYITQSTTP